MKDENIPDANIIEFKSVLINYGPEKDNLKCNTVREMFDWDFERIDKFNHATHVKIVLTPLGRFPEFFIREISHKCVWKGTAIISWLPKK